MDRLDAVLAWAKTPEADILRQASRAKELSNRKRYKKAMYDNNPGFREKGIWQALVIRLMHRKFRKNVPTRFGCTRLELRAHIEGQFRDGMSWENYASFWEIDHVVPCSKFDLPKELSECFHYTNLRPRICALNRIDGRFSMRPTRRSRGRSRRTNYDTSETTTTERSGQR